MDRGFSVFVVTTDRNVFHAINCERRETADGLIRKWQDVQPDEYLRVPGMLVCLAKHAERFIVEPNSSSEAVWKHADRIRARLFGNG